MKWIYSAIIVFLFAACHSRSPAGRVDAIEGILYYGVGLEPVPNARVGLLVDPGQGCEGSLRIVRTDDSGRFAITFAPTSAWRFCLDLTLLNSNRWVPAYDHPDPSTLRTLLRCDYHGTHGSPECQVVDWEAHVEKR
jgi:hypothetical protein